MLRRYLISSASRIGFVGPALAGDGGSGLSLTARSVIGPNNFRTQSSTKFSEMVALSFMRSIHSGKLAKDISGRTPGNMNHPLGLPRDGLPGGGPLFYRGPLETNADIVHIKLLRNNAFVTLTDSKGNKKLGVSAGKLAGKGGKLTRYSGEAAAEDVGRQVRQMKTRSVVVKVNGKCLFRRKKDAILAFKDGFTNSRGDRNPVVYLEDTTRKPHNGCRLPKKRRI